MNRAQMRRLLIDAFNPCCKDNIRINLSDIESFLQHNEPPLLIKVHDYLINIAPRLQVEIAKVENDKVSNAVLRIGYSANVEASFEQVQDVLRVINDAMPNANLIWGYGVDSKFPDGHCSILLLIG